MKTQNFPFIFSDIDKLPDDIWSRLLNPDVGTEQHDGETKQKRRRRSQKMMNPLKHLQPMSNKRFLNIVF